MGQTLIYTFAVTGMHCASCSMLTDETVEELAGVAKSATSLRSGLATVELDPTVCAPEDVLAVIAEAGYTVRLRPAGLEQK
jgi:copper chaperone